MTYAPKRISDLRGYWVSMGGVDLGIVGDAAHAASGGYHEGRDMLTRAGVLGTDYSVQLPRDKAGLSDGASAFDLGKLNGTLADLQRFSRWLVAQCQAKAPGTEDIREVIYSPDGKVVKRWSGVDFQIHAGYPTGTGNGDATHLWHTHISFFRDSEYRDKVGIFRPYFETPPETDTATEEPVQHPASLRIRDDTKLGHADLPAGHQLISPADVLNRFPNGWNAVYDYDQPGLLVFGPLDLFGPNDAPMDVSAKQPPDAGRDVVGLVQGAAFGVAALALWSDLANFTPIEAPTPSAPVAPPAALVVDAAPDGRSVVVTIK